MRVTLLERAIDSVTPLALAIAFWMLIGVMALLAAASSKGNYLTDIATVVGGFGQVFFAGAVYVLAKRQFKFTQDATERQFRMDAYSSRKALLDQFLELYEMTEKKGSSSEGFDEVLCDQWYRLADDISQVYPAEISAIVGELADKLYLLMPDTEYWKTVREKETIEEQQRMLKDNWKLVSSLRFDAWHKMHQAVSLIPQADGR